MALPFRRLRFRRALSFSSSLLHSTPLHRPKPISSIPSYFVSIPTSAPTIPSPSFSHSTRLFTSTSTLFRKTFDPDTDEIGPDTILFEGCDYNHWLITVDFPKDANLTREQKIDTYVNIAAQIFGSVEEAKKKIYALSTTTYEGFQVECSEETSEKFKSIPGVVFVLPDSYIDPVNKEYGGDKYVNGEIFPRPPPVHYGRRSNRDRNPRDQQRNPTYTNQGPPPSEGRNYGPSSQQNYRPSSQQNYGPPPQQNYGPPPPQQNYGPPPPQHNYGPPPQQSYGPQQQNYGPQQQNFGQSPQQNYGSPTQQRYSPPHQQNYGQPPQWQSYGSPQQSYGQQHRQSYGPPPQQNNVPPPQQGHDNLSTYTTRPSSNVSGYGERNPVPSHQEGFNQDGPANHYTQGQRNFQQWTVPSDASSEQRNFPQDAKHGSAQDGVVGQVPGRQRNFTSMQNN